MEVTPVHAVAVVQPVSDPARTAAVLVGALGFQQREAEEGAGIIVDNGALALRLVRVAPGPGGPARPLELDIETEDLDGGFEAVRVRATITDPGEAQTVSEDCVARRIALEGDVVVTLFQILTEDDLGVLPPLPAALVWDEASDLLVRRVLRAVPLTFRTTARMRVTRRAEAIALESGRVEVDQEAAVRGLVEATPDFQHDELALVLLAEGVDLSRCLEGCRDDG